MLTYVVGPAFMSGTAEILLRNALILAGFATLWASAWIRCAQPVPVLLMLMILVPWLSAFGLYLVLSDRPLLRFGFAAVSIAMGCLAVAPAYPWMALAAPIAGYGLAWVGHFAFEKNKPASWGGAKAAYWSLRGDLRMWMYMLEGTMDAEVERHGLAAVAA